MFESVVFGHLGFSDNLRRFCAFLCDNLTYFVDTTENDDLIQIESSKTQSYVQYECEKVERFSFQLERSLERWKEERSEPEVREIEKECAAQIDTITENLLEKSKSLRNSLTEKGTNMSRNVQVYKEIIEFSHTLLNKLEELDLPPVCSDILERTDAGSGVGI